MCIRDRSCDLSLIISDKTISVFLTFSKKTSNSTFLSTFQILSTKEGNLFLRLGTSLSSVCSHDFSIILSQHGIYHDNDNMEISVWGQSQQHYKIYLVNKEAKMLYPNKFQDEGKARQIVVPNSLYTLTVQKEINPNSLIIVISHTQDFDMLENYHINDFTEKLMNMKQQGYRLRMYDFVVK